MNMILTAVLAIWGAAGAAAPGSQPMQDLLVPEAWKTEDDLVALVRTVLP